MRVLIRLTAPRPLINMAVFSPPLIITKDQIDEMFDILEQALEKVSADVAKAAS